jgi:hypothetical protein
MASQTSSGFGLGSPVFVVFLVLKLTHQIDWSWWWVTAPLWVPVVALLAVFAVATVVAEWLK